jgi:hypothetical protein
MDICIYICRVYHFAGVARILSHEGGITDIEVLQVSVLRIRQTQYFLAYLFPEGNILNRNEIILLSIDESMGNVKLMKTFNICVMSLCY